MKLTSITNPSGEQTLVTTRDLVRQLRLEHPRITQIDLARRIGVTRERVRQILKRLGLQAVVPPPPVPWTCAGCKTTFQLSPHSRQHQTKRKYCDTHCRTLALWGIYPCEICGIDQAVRHKDYQHRKSINRTFTCSMTCRSKSNKEQSTALWKLHREHVGPREARSSVLAVPEEIRRQHGFNQPSYRQDIRVEKRASQLLEKLITEGGN